MFDCEWCGRKARKDTRRTISLGMAHMKLSAIVLLPEETSFRRACLWLCPKCLRTLEKAVETARKERSK